MMTRPDKCYLGSASDEELTELVRAGRLTANDAAAIRRFRDHLCKLGLRNDDSVR
jgi:hypothetical protein